MKIVADLEIPFIKEYFQACGELVLKPGRSLEQPDLKDADLLLVRSVTRVDERLLHDTAVKFVGSVTAGIDHLDTAWLEQAGIRWSAAAGYNADAVSDYMMAVVAALYAEQSSLESLRVGVVGVGQVGSRVAERFKLLGCKLFLNDPPRAEQEKNFDSAPLTAFRDLDLVTLHTPLTQNGRHPTYHLINSAFLSGASKKNRLINTGRGAVVDTAALLPFAEQWDYGFDVWEGEPQLDLAVLQACLIATPHLAGHSLQGRYRGIELVYRACCDSQFIRPQELRLPTPPRQELSFHNEPKTWQEIVLACFDPGAVTAEMKALLLKEPSKCATLFDNLRQQYIGNSMKRHELAFTSISQVRLAEYDRHILTRFGISIKE